MAWVEISFSFVFGMAMAFALLKLVFRKRGLDESATIPTVGDSGTVTVFGYSSKESADGVMDMSPFVARVEAFLRLTGQPYVKALAPQGPHSNPRSRKLPIANIRGSMVDDSTRIIEALVAQFGVDPDKDLTDSQRATAHLLRQTLTQSLYFVMLYEMFATALGQGCALLLACLEPHDIGSRISSGNDVGVRSAENQVRSLTGPGCLPLCPQGSARQFVGSRHRPPAVLVCGKRRPQGPEGSVAHA